MQPTTPTQSPITQSPISNYQDLTAMSTQPQAQAQTAPAQPQQNFLQRILPTLGSIGGFGLSALLAPETGGASLLMDAGLSGLGEGIGKGVENATSGQGITNGVAGDIASGALGGVTGHTTNAILDKVGTGIAAKGADMAGQAAEQETAQKTSQAALDEAKNLSANYGVDSGTQAANNMQDNVDLMKSWGQDPTDPNAMAQAAKGGLFIDKVDNNALEAGQPISTPSLLSSAKTNLNGNLKDAVTQATPEEQIALQNAGITSPTLGTVPETISPVQANQYARELNAQLRDLDALRYNASDVQGQRDAKQAYNQLNTIYKNVQEQISSPGVDSAIAERTVSPQEKIALEQEFGPAQANWIEDKVNSAQSHKDLVAAKLPTAQMSTISGKAVRNLQAAGTPQAVQRAKLAAGGGDETPPDPGMAGVANEAAKKAITQGPAAGAKHIIGDQLDKIMTPKNAERFGSLLTDIAPLAGGTATGLSSLPSIGQPGGQTAMAPTANTAGQPAQGQGQAQPQFNQLDSMLQGAMLDPNQFSGVLTTLAPLIQKAQAEQQLVQNLQPQYAAAGGAQGLGGGLLSNLLALVPGTAQYNYNEAKKAAATQGSQFGITAGQLPGFMTSPQGAQQQFSGAQNVLSSLPM